MMSSFPNSPTSPSFRTTIEQKIKSKNAALLLKNGSPTLREIFREKCRIRMKEARNDAFFSSRNIQFDKKKLITQIVRQELAEIEQDIELQDIIISEITDEWIWNQYEEYEKTTEDRITEFEENQTVFCPICQSNILNLNENIITCACGLRLYYPLTLSEFLESLLLNVKKHEQFCSNTIQFFTEPKEGFNIMSLHTMCPNCDFFNTIIN